MYLNTRIFPTTGHARVLLFMFIRRERELGGTGTGCLFQFTYCDYIAPWWQSWMSDHIRLQIAILNL